MPRGRSFLRSGAEVVLARSLLALAGSLPPRFHPWFSMRLAALVEFLNRSRRAVVRSNVELAFHGAPDAPDPKRLCRSSLASLCRSFMELAAAPRDPESMKRLFTIRNPERHRDLLAELERGPVIFAASHFGAYELAGMAGPLLGLRTTTLVRPVDNPWLDDWLTSARTRFGQSIASNRGGLRAMMRDLAAGRSLTILVDLNHKPRGHIFVDFFGTPAATAPTAGLLALRFQRPLVCVFCHRTERPLRVALEVGRLHWPRAQAHREEEIKRLMQAVTWDIEARVRAAPEQWLWTHRRWKTRPRAAQAPFPVGEESGHAMGDG